MVTLGRMIEAIVLIGPRSSVVNAAMGSMVPAITIRRGDYAVIFASNIEKGESGDEDDSKARSLKGPYLKTKQQWELHGKYSVVHAKFWIRVLSQEQQATVTPKVQYPNCRHRRFSRTSVDGCAQRNQLKRPCFFAKRARIMPLSIIQQVSREIPITP